MQAFDTDTKMDDLLERKQKNIVQVVPDYNKGSALDGSEDAHLDSVKGLDMRLNRETTLSKEHERMAHSIEAELAADRGDEVSAGGMSVAKALFEAICTRAAPPSISARMSKTYAFSTRGLIFPSAPEVEVIDLT